jgi:hypothetical protein
MSDPSPQFFTWDAEHSVMIPKRKSFADRAYVDGETYRLGVIEERSVNSHNHLFACVAECWMNLPDDKALEFSTPEALRKHALIMTGHREERRLVCSSPAEARKVAAFIQPRDDYAIISVNGPIVIEWRAKSMSKKAMGGPTFQRAKTDVLDFLSAMIGVTPETLAKNAVPQDTGILMK